MAENAWPYKDTKHKIQRECLTKRITNLKVTSPQLP